MKIAADYQKVVSEQIAAQTRVIRADGEQQTRALMTQAEVVSEVEAARGDAATKVMAAQGAVASFESNAKSYQAAPSLFLFLRWIDALSEGLLNRGLIILDERIGAVTGGKIYFNAGGATAVTPENK